MNSSLEHDEDVRLLIANKQLNPSYTLTDTLKRKLRDNLKKNKEPIIPNSSAYRCQQSELFKASRDHIDNSYQVKRFESENMDPKIDFEEKIKLLESKIDTMQINEINSRGYIQAMIKWDVTLDFRKFSSI